MSENDTLRSPVRAARRRRCPSCGKPATAKHRPFCSARCANLDLGRWLKGDYRIATEEGPGEGEESGADEPPRLR